MSLRHRIDRHGGAEKGLHPGRDDHRGIARLLGIGQQMIRAVERDEALRMLGRLKNGAGILDPDGGIGRRMQHQQRALQPPEPRRLILPRNRIEKIAPDPERAATD